MRRVELAIATAVLAVAAHLAARSDAAAAPTVAPLATKAHLISVSVTPRVFYARALVAKQFKALGSYDDGSQKDLTAKVTWSSSDPAAASVANGAGHGLVTTLRSGTTQIIATATSGPSGISNVVVGAQLVALQISPGTSAIRGGTGRSLHAVGTFSNGKVVHLRKELLWSSSDDTIASFSTDKFGIGMIVAANKLGTATITAAAPSADPDAAISATGQVTVSSLLASFKLLPKAINVRVAKSARTRIKALATFSDGAAGINITRFVDFESSDPKVALAKNSPGRGGHGEGVVRGIGVGKAEITGRSATTGVVSDNTVTVRVR